jgi:cytochrome c556
MSEETPSVDEIKARLKVEVPVEEEVTKADVKGEIDVAAELRDLGKQFAETLRSAWNSEERQRAENEVREGMRSFADEVDKVIQDIRTSPAAGKVKEEVAQVREQVQTSDVGRRARASFVQGLQWLSEELGVLAEKFTPPEKESEEAGE